MQVRVNGVDSNVVSSMRNARVELAVVTFTAQAAGLASMAGLILEVKQTGRDAVKDRVILVSPEPRLPIHGFGGWAGF